MFLLHILHRSLRNIITSLKQVSSHVALVLHGIFCVFFGAGILVTNQLTFNSMQELETPLLSLIVYRGVTVIISGAATILKVNTISKSKYTCCRIKVGELHCARKVINFGFTRNTTAFV
jgi:hypothetical protein